METGAQTIGFVVLMAALAALAIIVVRMGMKKIERPDAPDIEVELSQSRLRIFVFDDGWINIEEIREGNVVNDWEAWANDPPEVEAMLREAGLPSDEAQTIVERLSRRR